jgi:hypothetical protein
LKAPDQQTKQRVSSFGTKLSVAIEDNWTSGFSVQDVAVCSCLMAWSVKTMLTVSHHTHPMLGPLLEREAFLEGSVVFGRRLKEFTSRSREAP